MIPTGQARVAGVIGWPVGHSLSPRLHGYWLEQHGIDGVYIPLPIRPENLAAVVRALVDAGLQGLNVTLPHKETAIELCDELDPLAERIGAVNTLIFEEGVILGANSDVYGFLENLRQGAPDWDPAAKPAVVLGAGGAARAVVMALLDAGAPEIRLVNRSTERAVELMRALGGPIRMTTWNRRSDALGDAGILVNTTSLGMVGQPELDLELTRLPEQAIVNDIVYQPLETRLLARARRRGNPVIDGLGMLLHQGRPGFEAWFAVAPEVTSALRAFVLRESGAETE